MAGATRLASRSLGWMALLLPSIAAPTATSSRIESGSGPPVSIDVLSPPTPTLAVNSSSITIEVAAGNLASVIARTHGLIVEGVRNGDSYVMFNVPLAGGEANVITLDGVADDGATASADLTIDAAPQPSVHVGFSASPRIMERPPFECILAIEANVPGTASELWIDDDGDGVVDQEQAFSTDATIRYESYFGGKPRITVRTAGNLLFSSTDAHSPYVAALPASTILPSATIENAGTRIAAIEYDAGSESLFVLSAANPSVRRFDVEGALLASIPIPGASSPQDVTVDGELNLFIADTGNHRITKLLASSNYAPDPLMGPDGSFGTFGTGPGEFQRPWGVAVGNIGGEQKIFVSDTGNRRIQRFNRAGVFELSFDASEGGAPLTGPRDLLFAPGGAIVAADSGSNRILSFSTDGLLQQSMQAPFSAPRFLAEDSTGTGYVVGYGRSSMVTVLRHDGRIDRTFDIALAGAAPVSAPTAKGDRLFAAETGSNRVLVVPIEYDPPGQGSLSIAGRFVAALANGYFEQALELVAEEERTALAQHLSDPSVAATVMHDAAAVSNLKLRALTFSRAFVAGTRLQSSEEVPVEFVLQRSEFTGQWELLHF